MNSNVVSTKFATGSTTTGTSTITDTLHGVALNLASGVNTIKIYSDGNSNANLVKLKVCANVASYMASGTTTIDGSKITVGSIRADSININDVVNAIDFDTVLEPQFTDINQSFDSQLSDIGGILDSQLLQLSGLGDTIDSLLTPGTTTIDGGCITTGTIVASKIAAGAIISEKIAADAIIASKIAAGAVTADKIAANSVTAEKLAVDALSVTDSAQIANAVVQTLHIGEDQVTIPVCATVTDSQMLSAYDYLSASIDVSESTQPIIVMLFITVRSETDNDTSFLSTISHGSTTALTVTGTVPCGLGPYSTYSDSFSSATVYIPGISGTITFNLDVTYMTQTPVGYVRSATIVLLACKR